MAQLRIQTDAKSSIQNRQNHRLQPEAIALFEDVLLAKCMTNRATVNVARESNVPKSAPVHSVAKKPRASSRLVLAADSNTKVDMGSAEYV